MPAMSSPVVGITISFQDNIGSFSSISECSADGVLKESFIPYLDILGTSFGTLLTSAVQTLFDNNPDLKYIKLVPFNPMVFQFDSVTSMPILNNVICRDVVGEMYLRALGNLQTFSLDSNHILFNSLNGDFYSFKDGEEVGLYPDNRKYNVVRSYLVYSGEAIQTVMYDLVDVFGKKISAPHAYCAITAVI